MSRLGGGGVLTGEVKWNRAAVSAGVHRLHVDKLRRMATSGREWAHRALESGAPLLYVAAGGFSAGFREAAEADGHTVTLWSLADLYAA